VKRKALKPDVLGKLLFIQQTLVALPDFESISSFLGKALGEVPGVGALYLFDGEKVYPGSAELETTLKKNMARLKTAHSFEYGFCGLENGVCFPIRSNRMLHGALLLQVDDKEKFGPYEYAIMSVAGSLTTELDARENLRQILETRDNLEKTVIERTAELTKVNTRLRATGEEYQDLYDNAPCGYHSLNKDGLILSMNNTELRWLGYTRDEVVGKKKIPDLAAPEGLKNFQKYFPQLIKEGFVNNVETSMVRKDGTILDLLINATAIYDSNGNYTRSRSTVIDVTERKAAEEKLSESARSLAEAQRVGHIGSWEIDLQTWMGKWSDESYRIFGYEPGAFEPSFEKFLNMIHPVDRKIVEGYLPDIMSGKLSNMGVDFRITRPDGVERIIRAELEIVTDKGGKPVKLNGISYDITERKAAEEKLRAAKREAESANKLKSEILANMSHEVNTPFTSILGFTHLAAQNLKEISNSLEEIAKSSSSAALSANMRSLLDDSRQMALETTMYNNVVREQGQALFDLMGNLLNLSMLDAGELPVSLQLVSAGVMLTSMEFRFKNAAEAKGLKLDFNTSKFSTKDLLFMGDITKIETALAQLIQNAIKFSDKGKITVDANSGDGKVFFQVKDEGVGISDKDIVMLFDSFHQLDGSTTRLHGGLGLGLSLVKGLAKAMGGDVTLKTQVGKGTEFTLSLPFKPASI
jgi:PAS domain S-box-containing protein